MLKLLRILIRLVPEICHNPKSKILSLLRLSVMFSYQCYQTLRKTDETDSEGTLIQHRLHCIIRIQFLAAQPKLTHQQRELLRERRLLEIVPLAQLLSRNIQDPIQLVEKFCNSLIFIVNVHALDSKTDDIHSRKAQIATTDGSLGTEPVFKHPGTTSHSGNFMDITLRIILTP